MYMRYMTNIIVILVKPRDIFPWECKVKRVKKQYCAGWKDFVAIVQSNCTFKPMRTEGQFHINLVLLVYWVSFQTKLKPFSLS